MLGRLPYPPKQKNWTSGPDDRFDEGAHNGWLMSALPPKADIERHDWHVRLVPKADIRIAASLFDHSSARPRARRRDGTAPPPRGPTPACESRTDTSRRRWKDSPARTRPTARVPSQSQQEIAP